MAPSNSFETVAFLDPALQELLLAIARASIRHGLAKGGPLPVDPEAVNPELAVPRATFVSLHLGHELRGCMGSLEARRPLAVDIAVNAFKAAFRDHRFAPVTAEDCRGLGLELFLLTPAAPLSCTSQADLIAQLEPGMDGVILEHGSHCATFLPKVWEDLPEPRDFLRHLLLKAGLPSHGWSPDLKALRYRTQAIQGTL